MEGNSYIQKGDKRLKPGCEGHGWNTTMSSTQRLGTGQFVLKIFFQGKQTGGKERPVLR